MLSNKDFDQLYHDMIYKMKAVEQHPRGPLAADAARRTERTLKGWTVHMPPPAYQRSRGRDLHQGRRRDAR